MVETDVVKARAGFRLRLSTDLAMKTVMREYLEAELLLAYKSLANLSTSQDETQQIRGRITFINKLIQDINSASID